MSNKIYIDNSRFMELIDELATQITEMKFDECTYRAATHDVVMWNDAQDYYNEKYDEYEGLFNNIGNIYSDARQ